VEIHLFGDPVVRQCQIRDGKQDGVLVWQGGRGTIEGCDISGNACSGVEIREGCNPSIKMCKINRNAEHAFSVHGNVRGVIEDCDLRSNGSGAWLIDAGCQVQRSRNKE
jgi:parallel beta-helix repeat protein